MVLTVQGQKMWNVAFVTVSSTHTELHTFYVASIFTINNWVPVIYMYITHCDITFVKGARGRSGRVLDYESRGPGFDPHKPSGTVLWP